MPREIVDMLEPVLQKNMEDVVKALTKLQIQQKEELKKNFKQKKFKKVIKMQMMPI